MKIIALIITAYCLVVAGCNVFSPGEAVRDAIPGVYAAEWVTEFTVARDTILIEPAVRAGSGTYQITRRTAMLYQHKPQYKIVHWTGVFNSRNKTIVINNNGRILSFEAAGGRMKMGSTMYKKL